MTEQDINDALESVLKNKVLKAELGIDKKTTYNLRHRFTVATKLEVLWRANKLKLYEPAPEAN
ncbi:hypothetical protein ACFFVB_18515 [Formosa undariae]|uniref:Uncharacterized protein n=1 Tax=Formosa undariae TaxID=1325436 RepID=A0ABV5F6J9_9FLAO